MKIAPKLKMASGELDSLREAGTVARWRPSDTQEPDAGGRGERRRPFLRDVAVHVVTEQNLWRYVREKTACDQICDAARSRPTISRLVVPAVQRTLQCGLGGDISLIAIGKNNQCVRGFIRLSTTLGPAERYRPLEALGFGPHLRSPAIYIWDAFHTNRSDALSCTFAALLAGLQGFGLREDIEQICALIDIAWLPQFLELGWNPVPLGLPSLQPETSGPAALVTLDITEFALKQTRALLSICGPTIVRRGLARRKSSSDVPRLLC